MTPHDIITYVTTQFPAWLGKLVANKYLRDGLLTQEQIDTIIWQ